VGTVDQQAAVAASWERQGVALAYNLGHNQLKQGFVKPMMVVLDQRAFVAESLVAVGQEMPFPWKGHSRHTE